MPLPLNSIVEVEFATCLCSRSTARCRFSPFVLIHPLETFQGAELFYRARQNRFAPNGNSINAGLSPRSR